MRKCLKILFLVFLIILIKLVTSFSINEIVILNFNNNVYNSKLVKALYLFNYVQPYIAFYNEGNILYKTKKYDNAIEKYDIALTKNPPKKKVCNILINKSLAMIKQIDSSDYKDAYARLEDAKTNLYNNNCANPKDNNGNSKEAEQLEQEIKNLQEQLGDSSSETQQQKQDEEGEDEKEQEDYSDIEEELKEIEKASNANRQEDMSTYEGMGNHSYYSGKTW